jgi:hypothetical protein
VIKEASIFADIPDKLNLNFYADYKPIATKQKKTVINCLLFVESLKIKLTLSGS